MRKLRNSVIGASGLLLLAAVALPGTASAQETTDTEFELTGGAITLTVPPAATLGAGTTGADSVTGPLGAMAVDDARGVTTGWGVSAGSSAFTDGATTVIPASDVSYVPGAVTTTGDVTTTATPSTDMTATAPVVETDTASGNNTATWDPTLTVLLPDNALAGTYTGTVTTSVL